jgi:hypothetical protein
MFINEKIKALYVSLEFKFSHFHDGGWLNLKMEAVFSSRTTAYTSNIRY